MESDSYEKTPGYPSAPSAPKSTPTAPLPYACNVRLGPLPPLADVSRLLAQISDTEMQSHVVAQRNISADEDAAPADQSRN
jgi:hypothetical protein